MLGVSEEPYWDWLSQVRFSFHGGLGWCRWGPGEGERGFTIGHFLILHFTYFEAFYLSQAVHGNE